MNSKVALLSACLSLFISGEGHASGSVDCSNEDEDIFVGIGMTRTTDFFLAIGAYVQHGDRVWSTDPRHGEALLDVHQGMIESDRLAVDYFEDDLVSLIVSLRVFYGDEMEHGYRGTATFADGVVHPVLCTFG